jgi:hypothetical protein
VTSIHAAIIRTATIGQRGARSVQEASSSSRKTKCAAPTATVLESLARALPRGWV